MSVLSSCVRWGRLGLARMQLVEGLRLSLAVRCPVTALLVAAVEVVLENRNEGRCNVVIV